MKQPVDVIAERIGAHEAHAVIDLLKEAGWIIVRHDAIRKAQADEREAVKLEEREWYDRAHVIVGGVSHKDYVLYQPSSPQRMENNQ